MMSKSRVVWYYNNEKIEYKPKRTPALGWNTLTLLEALSDSAKTLLHLDNKEKALLRLNQILKILRREIETHKEKNRDNLLQRCEFRETKKTRCNRFPVVGRKNGLNLCEKHMNLVKKVKSIDKYF